MVIRGRAPVSVVSPATVVGESAGLALVAVLAVLAVGPAFGLLAAGACGFARLAARKLALGPSRPLRVAVVGSATATRALAEQLELSRRTDFTVVGRIASE